MAPGTQSVSAELRARVGECLSLLEADDVSTALGHIRALAASEPPPSLPAHIVGLASMRLREPAKALAAFEQAHAVAPETREHAEALGIVHAQLGHIADSLYFGKLAIAATAELGMPELLPGWLGTFGEAFYSMREMPLVRHGEALLAKGDRAGALKSFRQAAELDPTASAAWRALAWVSFGSFSQCYRPALGLEATERLLALPEVATADVALHARFLSVASDTGLPLAERVAEQAEDADTAYLPIRILAAAEIPDDRRLTVAAERFRSRFTLASEPVTSAPLPAGTRALRLGVIAGDWGDGLWNRGGSLAGIVPVLGAIDASAVRLSVYAADPMNSPLSRRLKGATPNWIDMAPLDDATLACIIANDRLDVLIDLDGTIGSARPALFGNRLARLQLSLYSDPGVATALGFDAVPLAPPSTIPADLPELMLPVPQNETPVVGMIATAMVMRRSIPMLSGLLETVPTVRVRLNADRLGGLQVVATLLEPMPEALKARIEIAPEGASLLDYLAGIDLVLDLPGDPYPDLAIAAAGLGVPVATSRSRQPRAAILAAWLDSLGLGDWVAPDAAVLVGRVATLLASIGEGRTRLGEIIRNERRDGASRRAAALIDTLIERLELADE